MTFSASRLFSVPPPRRTDQTPGPTPSLTSLTVKSLPALTLTYTSRVQGESWLISTLTESVEGFLLRRRNILAQTGHPRTCDSR